MKLMYYVDHRLAKILIDDRIEQARKAHLQRQVRRAPRQIAAERPADREVGASNPKAA